MMVDAVFQFLQRIQAKSDVFRCAGAEIHVLFIDERSVVFHS